MTSFPAASTGAANSALAGIGLMMTGIALFTINDALGKWLLVTYSVGQLLLTRSIVALILLAPFIRQAGVTAFKTAPRPGVQVLRVVLSTLEVAMFFWAVSYLPLADTITFYLAAPIYVTALSVVLLGERVGWHRWIAVLIGFAGVLIALRPSTASITLPAVIALVGSIIFAFLMITTRAVYQTPNTVLVTGQIVGTLVFGGIFAPFGWVTPTPRDLALFCVFGVISMVGLVCVNRSLKLAPASVVAPYQYTFILWGIALGYAVFGDVPDVFTFSGATIIVGAGLYIFWRERTRGVVAPAPTSLP